MRFVTTTGSAPPVSFTTALFDGLAPDGGLYVPERIEPWTPDELARLPRRTLTEIGLRAMRPFTRGELDPAVRIENDDASVRHPVKRVSHRTTGIA